MFKNVGRAWRKFQTKHGLKALRWFFFVALVFSIAKGAGLVTLDPEWSTGLIIVALFFLADHIGTLTESGPRAGFRVYPEASPDYVSDLRRTALEASSREAKLLEFSTKTVQEGLIRELVSRGFKIQVLLCHPEAAPNEYQVDRIWLALDDLRSKKQQSETPSNLEVRCYRQRAALSGRLIGDEVLSVGWYTYGRSRIHDNPEIDEATKIRRSPQIIDGHRNPALTSRLATPEGVALKTFFERVFSDLWKHAEPMETVLEAMPQKNPHSEADDRRSISGIK